MKSLSDSIIVPDVDTWEQKRIIFDHEKRTRTEFLKIGRTEFTRTIKNRPSFKENKTFIKFMLKCTPLQFQKSFQNNFPFFMLDLNRLQY